MHFQIHGDRALLFRGVDTAEHSDWLVHGVLRPCPGGMEFGKHLAVHVDHALAWRRILPTDQAFPIDVAKSLDFLGPRLDGIGPAYFATYRQLEVAIITEVPK